MESYRNLLEWARGEGIESIMLDEVVHELKSEEAAQINNSGLEDQLHYIFQACENDLVLTKKLILDYLEKD